MNSNEFYLKFLKNFKADKRFVGVWKGTDYGKFFTGEINSWTINRKADGTFVLFFETIHKDLSVSTTVEGGHWWVEDGQYFEIRDSEECKDSYMYVIHNDGSIQFVINEAKELEGEPYNFIDYKEILN